MTNQLAALSDIWAQAYRARQAAMAEKRVADAAVRGLQHRSFFDPARDRASRAVEAVSKARKAERAAAERLATACGHPSKRRRTLDVDVLEMEPPRLGISR